MVVGLDKFREHFAAHTDQYVLIGGVATLLALEERGLQARATKDLDIVLCVEALNIEFVQAFWDFVTAGGYENRQKSTGERIFYRFSEPRAEGYPKLLELFSKVPDGVELWDGALLTPIPLAEDVSSLSAILLDRNYYDYLHSQKSVVANVSLINEYALIPLKARAWLDLHARKEAGGSVDKKSLNKHRNDIVRLFQVLGPDKSLQVPAAIQEDVAGFLERAFSELDDTYPPTMGLKNLTLLEIVTSLRHVFCE